LSIEPTVPELIVRTPAPVVVNDELLAPAESVTALLAAKVVNAPVPLVEAPTFILSIEPTVPELTVIVPAPVVV